MDIEFIVQDIYSLTRPQWKLASNIEEASRAFQLAVAQDQKTSGVAEKAVEVEEPEIDESSDEGGDGEHDAVGDSSGDEEGEGAAEDAASGGESHSEEEEAIVVTRQQEQHDPEDEAEFEREYAKMMTESLESRKFDRKPQFDVPLPMRRKDREAAPIAKPAVEEQAAPAEPEPVNTMAFSLLTKRGNRPQTRTVELPSDSNFAVAMKTQQQAEREEQQRIKNLVLNYDRLHEADDQDGDTLLQPIMRNANIHRLNAGLDKLANVSHNRQDKSGNSRSGQRSRKLQLSDVDWYATKPRPALTQNGSPPSAIPLHAPPPLAHAGADRNSANPKSDGARIWNT